MPIGSSPRTETVDGGSPMIYQTARRVPVDEVIVHCSATRPSWMAGRPTREKVAEIRRWHVQDNGWKDIGYHWIIDRDGTVERGRPESVAGAHTMNMNVGTIGVCLIGGHGAAATDRFSDHFTSEQDRALRQLLQEISRRTKIAKVSGHNQYARKACPGFLVEPWLKS